MEQTEISDFDNAIIDALKSIIEVLAAKNLATHQEFSIPFQHQMKASMDKGNGNGAAIFYMLVEFCNNHGAAHSLHKATPLGNS